MSLPVTPGYVTTYLLGVHHIFDSVVSFSSLCYCKTGESGFDTDP